MSKKYALRSISYPYDNHYITTDTDSVYIVEYFDSKSEAEEELKSRLVDDYSSYKKAGNFSSFDVFDGYASEKVLEKASEFYTNKTGEDLSNIEDVLELELSDDEIVELMILLGINEYDVIEIDEEETVYAIWINKAEKYLGQTYGGNIVAFDNKHLRFNSGGLYDQFVGALERYSPQGELSDLSDDPDALLSFINAVKYLHYEQSGEVKYIYTDLIEHSYGYYGNIEELIQINSLLKKPWFEIREFTMDEIEQINKA